MKHRFNAVQYRSPVAGSSGPGQLNGCLRFPLGGHAFAQMRDLSSEGCFDWLAARLGTAKARLWQLFVRSACRKGRHSVASRAHLPTVFWTTGAAGPFAPEISI